MNYPYVCGERHNCKGGNVRNIKVLKNDAGFTEQSVKREQFVRTSLLDPFSNKTNKNDSGGERKANLIITAFAAVLFR